MATATEYRDTITPMNPQTSTTTVTASLQQIFPQPAELFPSTEPNRQLKYPKLALEGLGSTLKRNFILFVTSPLADSAIADAKQQDQTPDAAIVINCSDSGPPDRALP